MMRRIYVVACSPQDGLLGMRTQTNSSLVLNLLQESHASEIGHTLEISFSQVQRALGGLETAGLVVGARVGRERRVRLNPRYEALGEFFTLLDEITV